MKSRRTLLAWGLLVACAGCGHKPSGATADATAGATGEADTAETALVKAPETRPRAPFRVSKAAALAAPMRGDAPEMKDVVAAEYPEAGIKAIDPSCTKPWVVLASAKGAKPDAPVFATVAQALLANRSFNVADAEPHSAGELTVEVHKRADKDEVVAVARCHDAGTCTRLAAMIRAVTKCDAPETGCGELPNGLGPSTRVRAVAPAMPRAGDVPTLCARLGACKLSKDPTSSEDPVSACQKSPSAFNVSCALKPTCDEVVDCH